MQFEINPEAEFSTGEVDRMLSFRPGRTKLLCDKDLIPFTRRGGPDYDPKKGGTASHFRVKFKDFPKVVAADKATRKLDKINPQMVIRRDDFNLLIGRIDAMEDRLQTLEEAVTSPELAPSDSSS